MKYVRRGTTNAPFMIFYRDSCTWVNESASNFYSRFVNVVHVQNTSPVLICDEASAVIRLIAVEILSGWSRLRIAPLVFAMKWFLSIRTRTVLPSSANTSVEIAKPLPCFSTEKRGTSLVERNL